MATGEVIEILKKYNQEHVINILNKLKGEKKETLINQILLIDLIIIVDGRLYLDVLIPHDFLNGVVVLIRM